MCFYNTSITKTKLSLFSDVAFYIVHFFLIKKHMKSEIIAKCYRPEILNIIVFVDLVYLLQLFIPILVVQTCVEGFDYNVLVYDTFSNKSQKPKIGLSMYTC